MTQSSQRTFTDDGLPLNGSMLRRHGGPRQGAGAPPKPSLTRQELARAVDRCAEANGGRITLRGLTDAINEERTRGYVDPRSIAQRSVSTFWVRSQRKMLRESSGDGKANLIPIAGSRETEYQAVREPASISERSTEPTKEPVNIQVVAE